MAPVPNKIFYEALEYVQLMLGNFLHVIGENSLVAKQKRSPMHLKVLVTISTAVSVSLLEPAIKFITPNGAHSMIRKVAISQENDSSLRI